MRRAPPVQRKGRPGTPVKRGQLKLASDFTTLRYSPRPAAAELTYCCLAQYGVVDGSRRARNTHILVRQSSQEMRPGLGLAQRGAGRGAKGCKWKASEE